MRIFKAVTFTAVVVLGLSGCSNSSEKSEVPVGETAVEETAIEAGEETATPAQVASVIAQFEPSWREAMDGSIECFGMNSTPVEATDPMDGLTCRTNMETMTLQAKIVLNELGELVAPPELESLLKETVPELEKVAAYYDTLRDGCGAQSAPVDDECRAALANFSSTTTGLGRILNKWQPYISGGSAQAGDEARTQAGASITKEEAYDALTNGLASGATPAQWDAISKTVCTLLEAENGDAVATAQHIWDTGKISGTGSEPAMIDTSELQGGHMSLLQLGATQLECPQYQHAVADSSDAIAEMR